MNFIFNDFSPFTLKIKRIVSDLTRVAAVRAATNRIATRLRNLLLDPAVKQISSGALYQLDLDVIQCEQFAAGEPVPGLREGELLEHFASLRSAAL